ncbi:MAG: DEAD/DEAH box helicase, partial [Bacteroidales bacterium]
MNKKENKQIEAIIRKLGFESLKPMQSAMVDACRKSDDIILLSPTGSGKTLAFLLPVAEKLNPEVKNKTQVLILAPARELAQQIERVFRDMGTGLKVVCCYGGHSLKVEKDELIEAPAVLIGTPGRILDHMERGRIDIESINTLILDEFDKALELGFTEEMSAIIAKLTNVKRRMLTSATDAEIPEYTGMVNPEKLNFLPEVNQSKGLVLKQVKSPEADKLDTLYRLLCETGLGKKLVFCNYRESVERVSDYLLEQGIPNS